MRMKMTLDNLHTIALEVIQKVHGSKSGTATVITLHGDLGAGKTTLTQEIARILGIKENIISPTFVILKNYELRITNYEWKKLIHIDAYRLNKSAELMNLGWQELLADKSNLIIIEWPEQVPECIPENACRIDLSHTDENTRTINFRD